MSLLTDLLAFFQYGDLPTSFFVKRGMKVGKNFNRQSSTRLDPSHCWLITIGDDVTLSNKVQILAHDDTTRIYTGCGRIGTAVARHLYGFGVTIIGYAKRTKEKEGFSKIYHEDSINEFFGESDFVINTLPHDESTIGLINSKVQELAKPNMTFINIGRDTIFPGNDFYNHLKANKNTTAILDMFELVPNPITNKYRRLSNVLVMPRVASISKESEESLKHLISDNIIAAINCGELKNRVI